MTNDLNSLVDEVQKDDDENLIDVEGTWKEAWEMIEKEVRGDLRLPEEGDDEEC